MKTSLVATTKRLCLFVVLFINVKASAQDNLVNNSSFEDYIVCPMGATPPPPKKWYSASSYYVISYLNSCSQDLLSSVPSNSYGDNFQWARTGNAYVAIWVLNFPPFNNFRSYYQSKLKDSLRKDKSYYCEFFVVSTNEHKLKCNNISAFLSKTAVSIDTVATPSGVLFANAQIVNYGNPIITDTLNWIKVSSIYKAEGGEQYLTLGNFKDDANTQYIASQPTGYNGAAIMIDDVSVIPLDSLPLKADAGADTTITIGDSVFIGSLTNGIDTIKWLQNGVAIDSLRPGFWVKPLVNTCCILIQTVNGFTSSDTVCVTVKPLPLQFTNYELRITNETRNGNNEKRVTSNWTTANEINVSHFNILKSEDGVNFKVIGKVAATGDGIYSFTDGLTRNEKQETWYYKIAASDKDGKRSFSETKKITFNAPFSTFNLFPNPAKDFVTIECKGMKELRIVNQLGQVVYQQIASGTNLRSNDATNINTQQFAKGVYIVQIITTKGELKSWKFVLE
jgi:hypothetical protein